MTDRARRLTDRLRGALPAPRHDTHPAGPATRTAIVGSALAAAASSLTGHLLPDVGLPAVRTSLRWGARDVDAARWVELQRRRLDRDPPTVAIYLHGYGIDEHNWLAGDAAFIGLEQTLRWTPALVRYNSARHVASSGAEVSRIVSSLGALLPPSTRLVLVGHSLGGLVARAALAHLVEAGDGALERLTRLVFIATPHNGLAVEKLLATTETALAFVDELPRRAVSELRHATGAQPGHLGWRAAEAAAGVVPVLPGRAARLHRVMRLRADSLRDLHGGTLATGVEGPEQVPGHVQCFAVAGVASQRLSSLHRGVRGDGVVSVWSALGVDGFGDLLGLSGPGRHAEVTPAVHQAMPAMRQVADAVGLWVVRTER